MAWYTWYTMTTTIKISEANRTRLFTIKNQLEKEMKASLCYNDIVEILLNKLQNIETRQFIDDLTSLRGILTLEDKEYYTRMREVDKKRENRFIGH